MDIKNDQVKEEIQLDEAKLSSTYLRVPTEDDGTKEILQRPNFFSRYLGIINAVLGSLCNWASLVIVKYLKNYEASELISYRMVIDLIFLLPFLIQNRVKFNLGQQPLNLIFRGLLMTTSNFSSIYAIQRLPISEHNAILQSIPTMTAILSIIILKNKLSNIKIIAILLNIFGLILVSHLWTGLDKERTLGLTIAFLATVSYSLAQIILKKLSLDMNSQMIIFQMAWTRFSCMLLFTEISNNFTMPTLPKCNYESWFLSEPLLIFATAIFLLGFSTFSGKAMELESPTTVSAIGTSIQMPVYIISQWLIFNNAPSTSVVIGVLAVLLTSWIMNVDTISDKLSSDSRLKRWIDRINRGLTSR